MNITCQCIDPERSKNISMITKIAAIDSFESGAQLTCNIGSNYIVSNILGMLFTSLDLELDHKQKALHLVECACVKTSFKIALVLCVCVCVCVQEYRLKKS